MTKKPSPLVSIVVPCRKINDYIYHNLIPSLGKQSYKNFELILIPNKLCKKGPAAKRDLGVKKAKGEIIAFIDDDAYPAPNWLKSAVKLLKNPQLTAVCGPGLTPPGNNLYQQVSGLVWQTWLGAGGTGTYRNQPGKKRLIDDYPTFNLIVKKRDFVKIGGFNSHFWPGEDTKLCHDLVYKLKKQIIYDPKVLVYHHRRPIFIPHLKQIARFGLHRGHFARILPKTSFRLEYFIPSIFVIWLLVLPWSFAFTFVHFHLILAASYLGLLLLTAVQIFLKKKVLKLSLLLIPTLFLTHLVYGIMFIKGLLSKSLKQ